MEIKKNKNQLIFLSLLFLTSTLYWKSLGYGFYFDDYALSGNPYIQNISNVGLLFKENASRPVGLIIWMTISLFWGLKPEPFHLGAIILHLLCGLALYALINTIIERARPFLEPLHPKTPLIVSSFFLIHPLQTESVLYPVQAMSVLPMALSSILTVHCYINFCSEKKLRYLIFVYILTALAVLSREAGIVLPVILWLTDLFLLSNGNFRLSLKNWYIFVSTLIFSITIFTFCSFFRDFYEAGIGFNNTNMTPSTYLFTQFVVILEYIRLIFIPVGQNLYYDFPIFKSLFSFFSLLSIMVLFSVFMTALFFIKKKPFFSFGVFWFFIFLAPTSSIVPIKDVMFEHRLYTPMAGILISISSIFSTGKKKGEKKFYYIIIFVLFLFLIGLTSSRINIWQDNVTLWRDTVKKSPNKETANYNLGKALFEQSKPEKSIPYFKKALIINPYYADAHNNLAMAFVDLGRYNESFHHYSQAVKINPGNAEIYYNYGIALAANGMHNNAIIQYSVALKIKADFPEAYNNLGNSLAKVGRVEEAIDNLKKAINLKAGYSQAIHNLDILNNLNKIQN